ncbi:MAG: CDP-glucose 4,6-dehydratase [Candidatus Margulisbacteria bacterium]|nr:CDP-glucose 4,6-dehydratase [Candidatus Margulisiibacteriota bacterium]
MFNNFYRGKKVFITGHTGFKGSWLSLWLVILGAKVKGYALPPKSSKDNFVVANLRNKIISVYGDVRNYKKLLKEIKIFKPDIVFHLAAQPLVIESYQHPQLTYETNVMGTVNLLEAVRKVSSVQAVVNITTDKCYENIEKLTGYIETDPLGGYDPYSSSKGCSELVTAAYRRSFFTKKIVIMTARSGNVIGGGDWDKDRIIPDSMIALINKKIIPVRNPDAVRPWQHVFEPLSGYLLLAAKAVAVKNGRKYAGAWNFGPKVSSTALKVKDVVNMVIKIWGKGTWQHISKSKTCHEANILTLNCHKAKKQLDWQPVLDFKTSIVWTIEWYKYLYKIKPKSMYEYSLKQILTYCELAKSKKLSWSK